MHISKIKWGKIEIAEKKYHDILVYGDTVEERDYPKLKEYFDTSHEIGKWEVEKLFSNDPEVIIIGTGWFGIVKIPDGMKEEAEKKGIKLKILKSNKAVSEYNKLIDSNKAVNALIHSTC